MPDPEIPASPIPEGALPAAPAQAPPVVVLPDQPAAPSTPEVATPQVPAAKPAIDPHATPTLLEEIAKPEEKPAVEAKPVDPKVVEVKAGEPEKPVDPKVAEAEKPVEAAPEPIVYEFKLPEGIKADAEKIAAASAAFNELRIAPDKAQSLIDLHSASLKQFADATLQHQKDVWAETRTEWRKQAMADPEIGGAGWDTAKSVIARMRDRFISSAKPGTPEYQNDVKAFADFQRITGAGDHPVWLKFLHNVGRAFDEARAPPQATTPPADIGRKPGRRSIAMLRDGTTQG